MLPTDRRRGSSWSCAALIFLVLAASSSGRAQAAPTLPAAAQAALDQGVAAAKAAQYAQAIAAFEEARKAAPEAPIIYLNLGLAESKISGRELRSMAWFGAYLAADPNAPNAGAVKAEVSALKVRQRANLARLIAAAHDAASFLDPTTRDTLLWHVATAQARRGDIADAERVALEIKSAHSRTFAAISIANVQVSAGDLSGARRTLDAALKSASRIGGEPEVGMLTSAHSMAQAYVGIAKSQAAAADLSAAFRTANLIPASDYDYKVRAQVAIAEVQAGAGDVAGARKAFAAAQHTVDTMPKRPENVRYKIYTQITIAEAQAGIGDVEGAQLTLSAARRASAGAADPASRGDLLESIAKVNLSRGQAGADADADAHDTCNPSREETAVKASDWIAILIDNNVKHACPLNTSPFLDLTAQLGVLSQHTASSASWVLGDVVEQIVTAEKAVDKMLAHQLGH